MRAVTVSLFTRCTPSSLFTSEHERFMDDAGVCGGFVRLGSRSSSTPRGRALNADSAALDVPQFVAKR